MTEQYIECKRCGRELKEKRSREIGYGPTCAKKIKYGQEADLVELLAQNEELVSD